MTAATRPQHLTASRGAACPGAGVSGVKGNGIAGAGSSRPRVVGITGVQATGRSARLSP